MRRSTRRSSFSRVVTSREGEHIVEGLVEVELIAVALDVAEMRGADRIGEMEQGMARSEDRLFFEDVDGTEAGTAAAQAVDQCTGFNQLGAAHPLLQLDNALCTPHLGYVERDSYELYFGQAFDAINAFGPQ